MRKILYLIFFTVVFCFVPITCYAKPKIYVDAGHGCQYISAKSDNEYGFASAGAEGEAKYVGSFANRLIKDLNHTGRYKAVGISGIRMVDGTKGDRKTFGNSGRRDLFEQSDYDVMIQIHYDESPDLYDTGGHVIWSKNSANSYNLASSIRDSMRDCGCRMIGRIENSLDKRDELTVYCVPTSKPIVLIELGFGCKGKMDYEYLRDEDNKEMMCQAIINGIDSYFY